MEGESTKTEIEKNDIEQALASISEQDWKEANWPIVTYASKEVYPQEGEPVVKGFWEQVLNPKNFMYPNSYNSYDPEKHFMFVLHSLPNPDVKDSEEKEILKAIFTTTQSFVRNPAHMIKYKYHGQPCESRSRGRSYYPQCKFWGDFYDKLSEARQDKFPYPSFDWRKRFIEKNILKEKSPISSLKM